MVREGKRGERWEKGNERREKHMHRSGTNPFLCSFTYAEDNIFLGSHSFLLSSCQWNNFLMIKTSCQADWHFPPGRVQGSPFVQIWLKLSHSAAG